MTVESSQFGKSHWSLLMYAKKCCDESNSRPGQLRLNRMRCNPDNHPGLSNGLLWRDGFSSVTKDGSTIAGHDDWDCLGDLQSAGYLDILCIKRHQVKLTERGQKIAKKVELFFERGGEFSDFGTENSNENSPRRNARLVKQLAATGLR
ncbi:hypothetical protein [Vibrio barjaei]|uniref:hypothetical protein n=1 Tax=Vibrio barjaei TaxID=1676683 RepID=UPI0022848C5C|nr:hypothetical protein [Vibrio barjaei]MCY9874510.1 hypothetical protein [Vibrio barjaei]